MDQLEAIDRLNSWVRSEGARGWYNSPRYAVYDWKRDAVMRAIKNEAAQYRAIHLMMTCRACGGSKRYTDWSGYTWPHCRKCSSTGAVQLRFLETKIDRFRWHSPEDKIGYWFGMPAGLFQFSALSTDWEPNQKGLDLETWQVAECLNVLEAAVGAGGLAKPGRRGIYDYGDWLGDQDHSRYSLFLGSSSRVCQLCGLEAKLKDEAKPDLYDGVHHHVHRGNVDWCAWACDACKGLYATMNRWSDQLNRYVPDGGNCKSIFDEFPVPVEACQHPEINKWLERRNDPIWLAVA